MCLRETLNQSFGRRRANGKSLLPFMVSASNLRRQGLAKAHEGFATIAAVFILVLMASMGAFMANVSLTQGQDMALDLLSANVYQAALAGTEWGSWQVVKGTPPCSSSPGTDTNLGLVNGMAVKVNCTILATGSSVEVNLGSIYSITSTACNHSSTTCPGTVTTANYAERRISVVIETAP